MGAFPLLTRPGLVLFLQVLRTAALIYDRRGNESLRRDGPQHPHIIFVLADDLGWHDVGYVGGGIPTPTLDKLAGEGMKLHNYYVQPTCAPTRASLMTGLNPLRHGVLKPYGAAEPFCMPMDEKVLPEVLAEAGYEAHAVGKWHLGFWREECTPTFKGFKSFYGFYGYGENYWKHVDWSDDNGSFVYDFRMEDRPQCGKGCSKVEDVRGLYGTDIINQRAKKILTDHDANKPLFLYLAWQAVHAPKHDCPEVHKYQGDRDPIFACMLMMSDKWLAQLVGIMKQKDMLKDSIIVFSTDNGGPISTKDHNADDVGSSNYPLRGGKHTLFEGGTRGTGFMWMGWRDLPEGYTGLMSVQDWLPTLGKLANANVPEGLDGKDQWPAMTRGYPSPHNCLLTGVTWDMGNFSLSLRTGNWKIIRGYPGPKSLGWSGKLGSDLDDGAHFDPML